MRWRSHGRRQYVVLATTTILLGLAVHFGTARMLAPNARDIAGDALWAAMMTWGVSVLHPRSSLLQRGTVAYGVCIAVELSQLVHSPLLDALRSTTVGGLVLGSEFDRRDLVAYAVGVGVAVVTERLLVSVSRHPRP
jgi:hypothetical protein